MLVLYGIDHVQVGPLTLYKDLKIERDLSGEEILSFSYPVSEAGAIVEEAYVKLRTSVCNEPREYVIKEINDEGDWVNIEAEINLENIKGKAVETFEVINATITDAINLALAGTGWMCGETDITRRRTVRKANCSAFEILREIRSMYRADFQYDTLHGRVNAYDEIGDFRGAYFTDELNLRKLTIQRNTYDYYTRIIPIGKDGLKIGSVNGGKNYLENFSYTDKVIEYIWEDNRYTDAQSLKEDAFLRLNDHSMPEVAYGADVIDLAKMSDAYKNILDFDIGDRVVIMSRDRKLQARQRIVKLTEYPDEPERNTCELANRFPRFEDVQSSVLDATDTVNVTTTSDNKVDESKVNFDPIRQEFGTVLAEYATVTNLSAAVARIGTLEATSATITQLDVVRGDIANLTATKADIDDLEAESARIDTLYTEKASVSDLTAAVGRIGILESNSATIAQLNAVNVRIDTLYATDLTAIQAAITSLTTSKANVADLNATNAGVTNLTATVGSIDTLVNGNLTSANMAAGAIKAGDAVIANGAISNAMIESLSVSKLLAGDVSTTKFRLVSDTGNLLIADNTMQIADENRVRVQIGKDASDDYNMYVWDAAGSLMFDAAGLKASGIKDKIIRNDMVSDTANISAKKLDINSLFTEMNGSAQTLKGSRVYLDTQAQALDVAFTSLKTTVSDQGESISSQGTAISAIQGQITSKIWQTDINTAVNTIEVGGRNLAQGTATDKFTAYGNGSVSLTDGQRTKIVKATRTTADSVFGLQQNIPYRVMKLQAGKQYMLSFEARGSVNALSYLHIMHVSGGNQSLPGSYAITENFTKVKVPFVKNSNETNCYVMISTYAGAVGDWFEVQNIKVEEGNKATAWTEAPEDIQGQITTINDNYSTLTQTVDGIITSVTSLSSEIDTVSGNVTTVDNRVTTLAQTVDGLSSTVTSVQQNYLTKADASAIYATSTRVSTVEQAVSGISATISSIETTVSDQGESISTHSTQISGLNNAIILKLDATTFTNYKTTNDQNITTINNTLSAQSSSITALQDEIVTKVTQTEVNNAINAIEVGGRNLVPDSKIQETSSSYGFGGRAITEDLVAGETYTLTINGRCDEQAVSDGKSLACYVYEPTWDHASKSVRINSTNDTTKSGQFIPNWTGQYHIQFYMHPVGGSREGTVTANWVKLEKGNKSTDWTPAPEDVALGIENAQENLNEVRTTVAIHESQIVQHSDEISQKVDKTVTDEMQNLIGQQLSEITQLANQISYEFTRVDSEINDLGDEIQQVKTGITFDETGMTIGKSDNPMQMHLSNEQLEFKDSGQIVAYINGQKMYITAVEILQSLVVGNHKIEKYNNDITLVRWVG